MPEPDSDDVEETIKKLEEDPPKRLEDWPKGEAMYKTFGGGEGDHGYEEGPERKLGPSGLRHHEDGSVSIDGEKVDDPEKYKGEPIPGGPTDPNAPGGPEARRREEEQQEEEEQRSEEG